MTILKYYFICSFNCPAGVSHKNPSRFEKLRISVHGKEKVCLSYGCEINLKFTNTHKNNLFSLNASISICTHSHNPKNHFM